VCDKEAMYRSLILLVVLAMGAGSAGLSAQQPQPAGAQPPSSPTGVESPPPAESEPLPARPTPGSLGTAKQGAPPATTQMPSGMSGDATSAPAPKAPVEPNAAAGPESQEPPEQPKTEILDTSDTAGALATDGHDPILDPPPFPKGQTTLVGGIIRKVDRVRNQLELAIFGGGQWTIYFDERTHLFRNGAQTTEMALKKGERVYVDTMLDNNQRDIFARNIRMGDAVMAPADASGQIVAVHQGRHEVEFRDSMGGDTVRFSVPDDALISKGSQPGSFQDLHAGALVKVKFAAQRAGRGLAKEIAIVAMPGASFTFYGIVTFLDTHRGTLAVRSPGDSRTYEIHFSPKSVDPEGRLGVGAEILTVATFDGRQYTAQQITINKMAGAAESR
jgi:hypothetical protein